MLSQVSDSRVVTVPSVALATLLVLVGFTSGQEPARRTIVEPVPTTLPTSTAPFSAKVAAVDKATQSEGPNIAVHVRVYRVDADKFKQLGITWAQSTEENSSKVEAKPGSTKRYENIVDLLSVESGTDPKTTFSCRLVGDDFASFMDGLVENGVAKLVDKPTLVTRSGAETEFLSGGEVPFVTMSENGKEVVNFRPFGTLVKLKPVLEGDDSFRLAVVAELSEIAKDLGAENGVPGFRVRRVNTEVQVEKGKRVALSGRFRNASEKLNNSGAEDVVFLLKPTILNPKSIAVDR